MQALSLEQLAQAALQFHGQGKLREAEMLYRQLLAVRPNDADVFRQPARGDWRTPLERIARELGALACPA